YQSTVAACGARPEPLSPIRGPWPFGAYSTKQSPPIPVWLGSTTASTAAAATAASTALPPRRRTSIAADVARGLGVAAQPPGAWAGARPGSWEAPIDPRAALGAS